MKLELTSIWKVMDFLKRGNHKFKMVRLCLKHILIISSRQHMFEYEQILIYLPENEVKRHILNLSDTSISATGRKSLFSLKKCRTISVSLSMCLHIRQL